MLYITRCASHWGKSAITFTSCIVWDIKNQDCMRLYGACPMDSNMKGVRLLSEAPFKKQ